MLAILQSADRLSCCCVSLSVNLILKLLLQVPLLRNIAWTLSNLCRNKNPSPSLQSCCRCLPVFAQFLCHDDAEVLGDTCWALSYITDGSDDKIQVHLLTSHNKNTGACTYLSQSSKSISTFRDIRYSSVLISTKVALVKEYIHTCVSTALFFLQTIFSLMS